MTEKDRRIHILEHIPTIFHTDPTDGPALPTEASYLKGFLQPFQDVLRGFEDQMSGIDRHFDPERTPSDPDKDYLSWLAGWFGLVLDENWEEAKRRRLIGEAVQIFHYRGMAAGLKRLLKIYDDRITCVVHEECWPGGMQIGVASQIGGITSEHGSVSMSRIERMERQQPPVHHDYYVVDTFAPANHPKVPEGQPLRLYYRADRVKSVVIGTKEGQDCVILRLLDGRVRRHRPATVVRYDGMVHERYSLTLESGSGRETATFRGSTFLIEEVEMPYRFTIDIQVPHKVWQEWKQPAKVRAIRAIRAIIDEMKPAHTMYYLKLTPVTRDDHG